MKDFKETYAGYIVGDKAMEICTAEQKWIRKIKKWKEDYPDDVDIYAENKDGSILAYLLRTGLKFRLKSVRGCQMKNGLRLVKD
jgi:hypothetical protein